MNYKDLLNDLILNNLNKYMYPEKVLQKHLDNDNHKNNNS